MNVGFVKFYRELLDNPVVCKDSDHFAIWSYLLLKATHQSQKMMFEGKVIELLPGQLITGRKSISEKFNISESKVQRVLKKLEIEQQIEQQTTPRNRLITVTNWHKYQGTEQQTEQQVNNNRTTSEQQVNTNKNVIMEEGKNVKKVYSKDVDLFFEESWKLMPRKQGKGSVTDKQKRTLYEMRDEFMRCIERFKLSMESVEERYIPMGSTFFNTRYIDYLDKNYAYIEQPNKPKDDSKGQTIPDELAQMWSEE